MNGVLPMDRNRRGAFRPLTPDEKRRIRDIYAMLGETHPDPVAGILTAMGLPIKRKTVINVLNKAGISLRKHRPEPPPAPFVQLPEPSLDRKSQAAGEREEEQGPFTSAPTFRDLPAGEAARFVPREDFEAVIEEMTQKADTRSLAERILLAMVGAGSHYPVDEVVNQAKELAEAFERAFE